MTTADFWTNDPYFDEPEPISLDGGSTNRGVLWHGVSPRWGHAMHSMCSYHGMFPARLARYFIHAYTDEGGTVLDPFSGRGTTALEARLGGRSAIANDLSPLAYVLTRSKAQAPTWEAINQFIDDVELDCPTAIGDLDDVSPDIRLLFHPRTLSQLVYLRGRLLTRPLPELTAEEIMTAGAVAGILHGSHRVDGSSAYLSVSMPNTFSMSPGYVKKYIAENGLTLPDQDVFDCLRNKVARVYADSVSGPAGRVFNHDAIDLLNGQALRSCSVDLVLTSPPYLKVVNYGTANWIRLWWLGLDGVSRQAGEGRKTLDSLLDHNHTYERYRDFIGGFLRGVGRVLKPTGIAAVVIGDVAGPSGTAALAERIWHDLGEESDLVLLDMVEDNLAAQTKVSRIWGDTKGNATDRDCVLVLGQRSGSPRSARADIDWTEPYKDAGPDAAHERARRPVRRSAASS